MLYTRKGDDGTTKTFGCNQRVSKSSSVAEALGNLDEINSLLGICKVASLKSNYKILDEEFNQIILWVQETLFIVQAELAGADKALSEDKVKRIESIVDMIEKELPPIKTFFISGGSELGALFDFARTVSRRAERKVIAAIDDGSVKVGEHTKSFLNRLSSLLYALARYSNFKAGISEIPPSYK